MRKFLLMFLVVALLTTASVNAAGFLYKEIWNVYTGICVRVNGQTVSNAGINKDGVIYVPLRVVVEEMGMEVKWDDAGKIAELYVSVLSPTPMPMPTPTFTPPHQSFPEESDGLAIPLYRALASRQNQTVWLYPELGYFPYADTNGIISILFDGHWWLIDSAEWDFYTPIQ